MFKTLIISIFGLLLWQGVQAQKPDTLKFFLKNTGEIVNTKDSADYYRVVMPPDINVDKKLFPIKDFYANGQLKMTGMSTDKILDPIFMGTCTNYYPDGKTESIENYVKDYEYGNTTKITIAMYYPNGQPYYTEQYVKHKPVLITCNDSTGKQLADNGNGTWIKYDDDNKKVIGEGAVKDGVEDGEWHGSIGDSVKYTCTYDKGKIRAMIKQERPIHLPNF
jgi:antitoxin component YwqK of YwqJK toxin-antitoxin module